MKIKKENKKSNRHRNIYLFIFGCTCGIAGLIGGASAAASGNKNNISVTILVFLLSYFIHIILHEFGHMVFGLATGYKFSSFRIGNIALVKQNGKLRLKSYSLAGTLGQCLMIPPDTKDEKIPYALYNLGGVIMNILISAAATVLYFVCGFSESESAAVMIFIFMGFAIAALNGIPLSPGAVNNDGYNTLDLKRSPKALRSFRIQMKVNSLLVEGVRVKDMPEEWFSVPEKEDMGNSLVATTGVFACSRLMDMQDFDAAEKLTEEMLATDSAIVGVHRQLMICDVIYCKTIRGAAAQEIDSLLNKAQKKFMKSMKSFPSVIRTEYALALLKENNIPKAKEKLADFEKCAKKYPYPADIEGERELFEAADKALSEKTV
ncbi:MAG: M50 family metallopeptidase [Clostridia bacterium]|nr:M50 family metallopeptidase [Clostridia bacterium]